MKARFIPTTALVTALLLIAPLARADAPHRGDRHGREHRQDTQELRDDRRDLGQLQDLMVDLERARAPKQMRALRRVDRRIARYLDAEMREARHELDEARRAVRVGRHDRGRGGRIFIAARFDVAMQQEQLEEILRLRRQFRRVEGDMGAPALRMKQALLQKLIRLERLELLEDRGETVLEKRGRGRRNGH